MKFVFVQTEFAILRAVLMRLKGTRQLVRTLHWEGRTYSNFCDLLLMYFINDINKALPANLINIKGTLMHE